MSPFPKVCPLLGLKVVGGFGRSEKDESPEPDREGIHRWGELVEPFITSATDPPSAGLPPRSRRPSPCEAKLLVQHRATRPGARGSRMCVTWPGPGVRPR